MEPSGSLQMIGNERGIITLDFIFALTLAFGFSMVFFALSITLAMVEITQYVAFATARSYSGAHESQSQQVDLGHKKFDEIMNYPVFKNFYGLDWIKISPPQLADFNDDYPQGSGGMPDSATFTGARIHFQAKILNFRVPFLGQTATDTKTGHADIAAYLIREVSTEECRERFNRVRYQRLKQINSGGATPYAATTGNAIVVTDNGC